MKIFKIITLKSGYVGLYCFNFDHSKSQQLTCFLHMFLLIDTIVSISTFQQLTSPNRAQGFLSAERLCRSAGFSPERKQSWAPPAAAGQQRRHHHQLGGCGLRADYRGDGYYSVPTGIGTLLFVFYWSDLRETISSSWPPTLCGTAALSVSFSDSRQISVLSFRFLARGRMPIIISVIWRVSVCMLFLARFRWAAFIFSFVLLHCSVYWDVSRG